MNKLLKLVLYMATGILALFFALPFLLPVNRTEVNTLLPPYSNSHFDTIQNLAIHYRTFGFTDSSAKPTVIFVHGFAASTFCWRNNYDTLLAQGYQLLSVDVPAFGYSDKRATSNYSTTHIAESIWDLTQKLGVKTPSILIGHSMGGGIVTTMAALRPSLSRALVCVDGVTGNLEVTPPKLINTLVLTNRFTKRWSEVALKNYFLSYKQFNKLLSSAYSRPADSTAVVGYMEPFKLKGSAASIFTMTGSSREICSTQISAIKCPVLVIWGEKDTWVSIQTGKQFLKYVKQAKLETIPGAGHCGMETHPKEFNTLVTRFLKGE